MIDKSAEIRIFVINCIIHHKKGRSLLNILTHHYGGVVNITIYLQLFQDLSYNPLVGFIDGCYVY